MKAEPKVSQLLGQYSDTEPHPQPKAYFLISHFREGLKTCLVKSQGYAKVARQTAL